MADIDDVEPDKVSGQQFNRRFRTGCLALALITVSYYICMFKHVDLSWFLEYSKLVVYVAGGVILGITLTDSITNWKRS